MKPLSAPDDFDTQPRWNPTLLDPDDRTAMERSGQLSPDRSKVAGRIRTLEDQESAVSAVAIMSAQPSESSIQLVSGVAPKQLAAGENTASKSQTIRFRPVATLK